MTDDQKDLRAHLENLLLICERAERVRVETNERLFYKQEIDQMAVAMLITRLGEASVRILRKFSDFAAENPQLPFHFAKGMRNRIVHDYEGVSLDVMWDTFDISFPIFHEQLKITIQAFDAKNDTL